MVKKSLTNLVGMLGLGLLLSACSGVAVPTGNDAGSSKSNAKDVTLFSIGNRVGLISETDITVTLPYGTTDLNLTPTIIISAGAGVSPASGVAQDFTNPVIYTVTAENGTTKAYTVTVTVAASDAKEITVFSILDVEGEVGANNIAVTVPYGTPLIALTPTITITGASISPASGVAQDFTYPVTYTVTAADGSSQAYIVTVHAAPNSANEILAFFISDRAGAIKGTDITVTLPYGTDVTALTPTLIVSAGAGVNPASGVAQNFATPVIYTVTAEDGTPNVYTVTVTVAAADDKDITAFSIGDRVGAISGTDITVTLPYGTDVTSLTPSILYTGTSIFPAVGVARNFTNPLTYTVTAEDSTTKVYTVTVTVAASDAKDIIVFFIGDRVGAISGTNITVTLPYGSSVTPLTPFITYTGASISPAIGVPQNFTNPVNYTVTAENGTTKLYTVTVTVTASSSKDITAFSILDVAGVFSGSNISVTIPYGSPVTPLTPSITHTGASIIPAIGAAQNFTNPVTYTVTAADGSTKPYLVTVHVALNSAKEIVTFSIAGVAGTITDSNIAVSIPCGAILSALIPTITVSAGASVNPASGAPQNFTSPTVLYTVTAANGTIKYYRVTVMETCSEPVYNIGDIGPANGFIFYENPNYAADGWKYLEAASTDQGFGQAWSNVTSQLVGGTGTAIGTGQANTAAIITQAGQVSSAAKLCTDLVVNKGIIYQDWFLPSENELNQMNNIAVNGVGGFVYYNNYWSSSEDDASTAWGMFFNPPGNPPGGRLYNSKSFNSFVRCARAIATTDAKNITAFYVLGKAGVIRGTSIEVTVPFGSDVTELVATFAKLGSLVTVGATPQVSGITANNFTNPVHYIVAAEDATTRDYTVTVTVAAPSRIATVTSAIYSVSAGGTANETITNVPFGTISKTNFLAVLNMGDPSQTWNVSGIHNPVLTGDTLVVTAQDETTVVTYTITTLPPSHIATVTSAFYSVSAGGTANETITNIPFGTTSKTDFLNALTMGNPHQTWNDTGIHNPILTNDTLVVTAQDGTTVVTYTITILAPNNNATVTSAIYTVSAGGTANETIILIPHDTRKTDFLNALTTGNPHQTWNITGIHDPVLTDNTLVVTAQDGTTVVTYTVTVNLFNICETTPLGGRVFYLNPNYVIDGWEYLEVSPADQSSERQWAGMTGTVWSNVTGTLVGTETAIGKGATNTAAIIAQQGHTTSAAYLCNQTSIGGLMGWFLPSKDELNKIYVNGCRDGSNSNWYGTYWTSSENSEGYAWDQYLTPGFGGDGTQGNAGKGTTLSVRCIRAF